MRSVSEQQLPKILVMHRRLSDKFHLRQSSRLGCDIIWPTVTEISLSGHNIVLH